MKLSMVPVSYFNDIVNSRMTLMDWAREGVRLGLDAIDISTLLIPDYDTGLLEGVRKEIEAEGIQVLGSSSYPDFTNPNPIARDREIRQFDNDLEALAALGTRIVRVTAGQAHPGISKREGLRLALDGILRSVPKAQSLGIKLLLENHSKPGVWRYYDFGYPTDIFLDLFDGLKDSPVGILFDTANPVAFGDDSIPILNHVYDRVCMVHAADTSTHGTLTPSIIGKGLVDFDAIFSCLASKNYSGWFSIEEASGTGAKGMLAAVEFVRSTWARSLEAIR